MRIPVTFTYFLVLSFTLILCNSCKKDDNNPDTENPVSPPATNTETGQLNLNFSNMVDSAELILNQSYKNALGESYSISKFNYYISNVSLIKEDNSTFEVKNIYRIVKQNDDTSKLIKLQNIPAGNYKAIKFMLGIDSASNNSGAHSGGLDFDYASDMFWGWNQGYIFLKLEGTAPTSTLTNSRIEYHIGGYGGIYKTQQIYNLSFGSVLVKVSKSSTPNVHLSVNANEIFVNPQQISFATKPQQTSLGAGAKLIADNYSDMIRVNKITN